MEQTMLLELKPENSPKENREVKVKRRKRRKIKMELKRPIPNCYDKSERRKKKEKN